MDGQFREQLLELVLVTDEAHGLGERHRWRQQSVGDGFWHHVGHTNPEQQLSSADTAAQRLFKLVADLENLVGVGDRQFSGCRQFEPPSDTPEQVAAQRAFELAELAADGLGVRCSRSAARVMLPALATFQK